MKTIIEYKTFNEINCGGSGDCQQKVLQYLLKLNQGTLDIKRKQIAVIDLEETRKELSDFTLYLNSIDDYVPFIDKESIDILWSRYTKNPELNRGSEFWLLITASRLWNVKIEVHFLHNRKYTRTLTFDWTINDECEKEVKEIVYDLHGLHYMAYES